MNDGFGGISFLTRFFSGLGAAFGVGAVLRGSLGLRSTTRLGFALGTSSSGISSSAVGRIAINVTTATIATMATTESAIGRDSLLGGLETLLLVGFCGGHAMSSSSSKIFKARPHAADGPLVYADGRTMSGRSTVTSAYDGAQASRRQRGVEGRS